MITRPSDATTRRGRSVAWLLCAIGFTMLFVVPAGWGEPSQKVRRPENVPIGDCKACHEAAVPRPADHKETKDMELADCTSCHAKGTREFWTKLPLGHIHGLNGVGCRECHEATGDPKPVETKKCLGCHGGIEKVAALTAKLDPDPHKSPHYGTELDCELCHHQHAKSDNFCSQCHSWELRVP